MGRESPERLISVEVTRLRQWSVCQDSSHEPFHFWPCRLKLRNWYMWSERHGALYKDKSSWLQNKLQTEIPQKSKQLQKEFLSPQSKTKLHNFYTPSVKFEAVGKKLSNNAGTTVATSILTNSSFPTGEVAILGHQMTVHPGHR